MKSKIRDKTINLCKFIVKQDYEKYTGEITINYLNGKPVKIKKTIPEKI